MAGLVPAIHALLPGRLKKTWMPAVRLHKAGHDEQKGRGSCANRASCKPEAAQVFGEELRAAVDGRQNRLGCIREAGCNQEIRGEIYGDRRTQREEWIASLRSQ